MPVAIKSGATSDLWTVNEASDGRSSGRVTLYDSTGALISNSNPLTTTFGDGVNSAVQLYSATAKAVTTLPASATLPFIVLTGSKKKVVKLLRILISGTGATGNIFEPWGARFSSISFTSVPTLLRAAKTDSNDAESEGKVYVSTSTLTATFYDGYYFSNESLLPTGAAAGPVPGVIDLIFSPTLGLRPVVLRDFEWFGIGSSNSVTTPTADFTLFWSEEST